MLITRAALEKVRRSVGTKVPETGGMLVGPRKKALVTNFYFDTEGSNGAGTHCYSPAVEPLNRILAGLSQCELKGFIHSHPAGITDPSWDDRDYARRSFDANPGMPRFYMAILVGPPTQKITKKNLYVWTFCPDGEYFQDKLMIVERSDEEKC